MPKANAKLRITFDFDVELPESVLSEENAVFQQAVETMLGSMVLQGMPAVTGKQLEKAGGKLCAHTYRLDAMNLQVPQVSRETLVAAAPHLMDAELDQLARRIAGKLPDADPNEQMRTIRRHALSLVNEYRTVPCVVTAKLTSGTSAQLEGKLNLTNGSVLLGEQNRQVRLQPGQEDIRVTAAEGNVSIPATCAGHTLSGPVIETAIADLVPFRDCLIDIWQKQS